MTTDVMIVGAGPTGLALALQLRRMGVSFRIIDKNPAPSTTSKALGLQYRVSEVLAWLGLTERFRARGNPIDGTVNVYTKQEPILRMSMSAFVREGAREAFAPRPIVIPQSETEAILIEAL